MKAWLLPDDVRRRYGFFAAVFVCVLLRVRDITESIWLDESISLLQAQPSLVESVRLVQGDVHVPLYTLLLNLWMSVFGDSVVSARSLSVVLSVATVFFVFAFCKRFFDESVGVYAVWLFSTSEILVYYGQEIRPYSLFVFLAVASFYSYAVCRETGRGFVWYALINAALCYTHPFASFAIAAQVVHYAYDVVLSRTTWSEVSWFVGSYVVTGLLFLPWLPTLFEQAQRSTLSWIPMTTASLVFNAYRTYFELPGIVIVLGVLGYAAWRGVRREEHSSLRLLAVWIVIPLFILLAVSVLFRRFFHQRYLLFTVPALYVFVAVVVRRIESVRVQRVVILSLVFVFLVTPLVYGASERDDWKGVASYLERHRDGEPVVIYPYYQQQPLTYYYSKECFSPGDLFSCNKERAGITNASWEACCSTTDTGVKSRRDRFENGYWLVIFRDDERGSRVLQGARRDGRVTRNASFSKGIDVYKVISP